MRRVSMTPSIFLSSITTAFVVLLQDQEGIVVIAEGELPAFNTPAFTTGITHYQNFCDLNEKVENGEIQRRNALQGRNLTVGLSGYYTDENTGMINEKSTDGITVQVLDELARRAGFTWRHSYGIVDSPTPPETWTSILDWGVSVYDVMGDWWMQTNERLEGGISFPAGFYDASVILVKKIKTEDKFNFWAFAAPFSPEVWFLLAATIVFTGIAYFLVDTIDSRRLNKKRDQPTVFWSIYSSIISFTDGSCVYGPKSLYTCIVTISTGFVFLLTVSSYTANLTNFLITKNAAGIKINDIRDAIKNNLRICVWEGTGWDENLQSNYPKAFRVPRANQEEAYVGLHDGSCDLLLTTADTFKQQSANAKFNSDCDLDWVGRVITVEQAGLAVRDSLRQCTPVVTKILNIHMREMIQEGKLREIWEEYIGRTQTIDCEAIEEVFDDGKLSITNVGGIIAFHAIILTATVLFSLVTLYLQPENIRTVMKSDLKQLLRKFSSRTMIPYSKPDTASHNVIHAVNHGNNSLDHDVNNSVKYTVNQIPMERIEESNNIVSDNRVLNCTFEEINEEPNNVFSLNGGVSPTSNQVKDLCMGLIQENNYEIHDELSEQNNKLLKLDAKLDLILKNLMTMKDDQESSL